MFLLYSGPVGRRLRHVALRRNCSFHHDARTDGKVNTLSSPPASTAGKACRVSHSPTDGTCGRSWIAIRAQAHETRANGDVVTREATACLPPDARAASNAAMRLRQTQRACCVRATTSSHVKVKLADARSRHRHCQHAWKRGMAYRAGYIYRTVTCQQDWAIVLQNSVYS